MGNRPYLLLGIFLLAISFVWPLFQESQNQESLLHKEAPDFQLPLIAGKGAANLAETQGQVRLVAFWASWCAPCIAEIPLFNRLQTEYGSKGLSIIAVNLDEDRETVLRLERKYSFAYPIVWGTSETVAAYGHFTGVPTSFLVGRDGKVRKIYPGAPSAKELEQDIQEALLATGTHPPH